ncbi:DUF3592 domain-containing protein [Actinoplanes sp. L3-i22]|uniref:DUF3592 domain-containing protein n=1 Tax=Actinoplanes sp. L3-i22 TaxID=2836373 RepID=UPI001C782678|nr:DUF3592 domain-containing protein [Actinoplanes sp. L3-i22]BCY12692.1 hypothetical protein L3i22_077800 [Actinoplanes sp. L3-i22]
MTDDGIPVFALLVSALVVLIPAIVGLLMIAAGLRRWSRARRLTADGERALATVVDNQVESRRNGAVAFLPVVAFTTRDGRAVRTVLDLQASNRSHLSGSQQTVIFDPAKPERAMALDGQHAGMAAALVIGSVFLLFAGVALFLVSMIFLAPDGPFSTDPFFGGDNSFGGNPFGDTP